MNKYKAVLMDEAAINRALKRISHEILERNKGKAGEVFLDIDLNSENGYFRPSSN